MVPFKYIQPTWVKKNNYIAAFYFIIKKEQLERKVYTSRAICHAKTQHDWFTFDI